LVTKYGRKNVLKNSTPLFSFGIFINQQTQKSFCETFYRDPQKAVFSSGPCFILLENRRVFRAGKKLRESFGGWRDLML